MARKVILVALLLGGCATTPAVRVETQTVKVPTPVPCVKAADIPATPAPLGARPATVSQALDLALAKLLEWSAYGDKTQAVLKGCAE